MTPHMRKTGAAMVTLLIASVLSTDAFAIRNRYTQEQSSELGVVIQQALGARDSDGRPARFRHYPSEFYGQPAATTPRDDDDGR